MKSTNVKRKKKATKKLTKKSTEAITPKDLIPAHYNPRRMDDDAKKALKKSMQEFNDISGITWNKSTGNIVTGHHRWEEICALYGIKNLSFKELTNDRVQVLHKEEDTGYIIRIVEWDEKREKAANITANSHKISGEFTDGLKGMLADMKLDLDDDLFSGLRFDDLSFEQDYLNLDGSKSAGDDDWDTDIEVVKNTEEDDHQSKPEFSTITINVKTEQKTEVVELIKAALKGHEFDVK